jgi:hypothetical protein
MVQQDTNWAQHTERYSKSSLQSCWSNRLQDQSFTEGDYCDTAISEGGGRAADYVVNWTQKCGRCAKE